MSRGFFLENFHKFVEVKIFLSPYLFLSQAWTPPPLPLDLAAEAAGAAAADPRAGVCELILSVGEKVADACVVLVCVFSENELTSSKFYKNIF